MSGNKKNVPKRRFKEFKNAEAWEQRKLLDSIQKVIDFRGRTPKKLGLDWSEAGYLALSALNVKNGYIDESIDAHYGNQELYDAWMSGNELHQGQVLFTTEAPMGNVAQVPDNKRYILSQRTIAFEVDEKIITENYLATVLGSPNIFNRLTALSTGGTAKGVSQKSLSEFTISLPNNVEEQNKIGVYFKQLDNFISLHQRKLEKMKALKKAYLTEMFPAEGERKPKLRFAGFTDDWEQCKLGELTEVHDGTHQTPKYTDSGIMFLSVENIKTLKSEKYISEEAFKSEFKVFPEKGDVLMTRIGDIGTANVFDLNEPTAYYVSLALLKCKELNPYFLKESIYSETVKKDLWHRTLHIAFPKKINKNEIEKVKIPYPKSKLEQKQIGSFFKNLDDLITLHQRKLEKLQDIKKAYLNEMFI